MKKGIKMYGYISIPFNLFRNLILKCETRITFHELRFTNYESLI